MIILSLLALVVLLIVLFLLLFIFGLIHIAIDAKFVAGKPDITVKILLWKIRLSTIRLSDMDVSGFPFKLFFKGKLDTPVNDAEDKQSIDKKDIKEMLGKFQSITSEFKDDGDLGKELLNLLRIHDIKWTTTLGLEEAPLTAFATGMVWTLKYNLIGRLMDYLKGMERPTVDVRPAYQKFMFQTHIKCMITFRLGKAIHAAYRIAKIRKRRQVGKCQNIQYKA